jgi:hypothetical protein
LPKSFRAATTAPRPLESRNSTSLMSAEPIGHFPTGPEAFQAIALQPTGDLAKTVLELDGDGGVDPGACARTTPTPSTI